MAKRAAPKYRTLAKEAGDGSFGIPPHDDDGDQGLVVVETILPPRLVSKLYRSRPVFVVAHPHDTAGEENQDARPEQPAPTKRPVRRKEGGFRFKLGS